MRSGLFPCLSDRLVLVLVVHLGLISTDLTWGQSPQVSDFDKLVQQLDDPQFQRRRGASRQLIEAAAGRSIQREAAVRRALAKGLMHRSLEVRMGARETLQQIDQRQRDAQIQCLLNPRCDPSTIRLAGWQRYSARAGSDMAARRLFAVIAQRFPVQLMDIDASASSPGLATFSARADPYRLPPEEAAAWSILLLVDLEHDPIRSNLTSKLGIALSSASMGPAIASPREAEIVRRLVAQWIEAHQNIAPARQRLLIAARYQCDRCAARLCRQVLTDRGAPAATQVTALLTALALGLADTELQAQRRLNDDRTALVWQLIASRKKKIRTQVRDVALVVLLHQQGIDPRSVGFDELQADPVLVFRDHSLGFPDDRSRRDSHRRAMQLLPSIGSP